MAQTVNEAFFDALLRHQIGLLRLSGSIRNDVFTILDATEADMTASIRKSLAAHKGFTTPASIRRLERLLASIRATRLTAWGQVNEVWIKELTELAQLEPKFVDGALKTVSPVILETTLPSVTMLKQLVATQPFEGKTLKQWSRNVAAADINRIETQIKVGMVQGETGNQIARRVVGTVAQKGRNGVTQISRNNAEAITRTAVNAVSNQAKRAYYIENKDIFKEEQFVATLDNRTTNICMSLDGRRYPVGDGPLPPMHIRCRSTRIAVIGKDALGDRPARPFTKRSLLKEYTSQNKLRTVTERAKLPRGHKGKYDTFQQKRIRELTGRIPAKVTYQEWLTRQSVPFQNDVLGVTKARLFRRGGLKLDKFVNRAGDELNLSQLARKNADAFRAAGLDPSEFL